MRSVTTRNVAADHAAVRLPVIEKILGRVRNMLIYQDGRRIWPSFQDGRFREIAPIRQYRVIQRAADKLELQVAADRLLSGDEKATLADMILDRVIIRFMSMLQNTQRSGEALAASTRIFAAKSRRYESVRAATRFGFPEAIPANAAQRRGRVRCPGRLSEPCECH